MDFKRFSKNLTTARGHENMNNFEKISNNFASKYGHFSEDGLEYIITRPDTPKPWVNVVSNGDYGFVVSQSGGGYSWRSHASLNRLTCWNQDLIRDADGRFLYLLDEDSNKSWSLAWMPTKTNFESFECRHGPGYTKFTTMYDSIEACWTLTVEPDSPLEIWYVTLRNMGNENRILSLFSYCEWLLGKAPDWHREFNKTFIETMYDAEAGVVLAKKNLWDPPVIQKTHWNMEWPYVAFHASFPNPIDFETDKQAFLGQYGSTASPLALHNRQLTNRIGRWGDAIASLRVRVELPKKAEKDIVFLLGAADTQDEAIKLTKKFSRHKTAKNSLEKMKKMWLKQTGNIHIESPDPALNLLTNHWLAYQTISGRLWARTAYYQTGGAFGYRDQLQDSLIFLLLGQPEKTLKQIRLNARHQYTSGEVQHWWHPLPALGPAKEAESGLIRPLHDNMLWLCFVTARYLEETGNFDALDLSEPFVDSDKKYTLWEHCKRSIELVLNRLSSRGLPLIGGGDWNDGMNAAGIKGKGESIWLAHFFYGILNDFASFAEQLGEMKTSRKYRKHARALGNAINNTGWDGKWYWRASTDDGMLIGSSTNKEGKIFLNAQTWAVLSGSASKERSHTAWKNVEKWLLKDCGPILFYPAYSKPDARIGYLSRYAPGVRENGGVYTHSAAWAILAASRLGLRDIAYEIYKCISPPIRSSSPDLYQSEPYVLTGSIDGPDSPNFGRGGWTWYSGSAQWLLRVTIEGLFGIQPTLQGLCIKPCLPGNWGKSHVKRYFRGSLYEITYHNSATKSEKDIRIILDGKTIKGNVLPLPTLPVHKVVVEI